MFGWFVLSLVFVDEALALLVFSIVVNAAALLPAVRAVDPRPTGG